MRGTPAGQESLRLETGVEKLMSHATGNVPQHWMRGEGSRTGARKEGKQPDILALTRRQLARQRHANPTAGKLEDLAIEIFSFGTIQGCRSRYGK
jgi:hypothetical protein